MRTIAVPALLAQLYHDFEEADGMTMTKTKAKTRNPSRRGAANVLVIKSHGDEKTIIAVINNEHSL